MAQRDRTAKVAAGMPGGARGITDLGRGDGRPARGMPGCRPAARAPRGRFLASLRPVLRHPLRHLGPLAAVVLSVLFAMAPAPAEAQTDLVSNTHLTRANPLASILATAFTTGSNEAGYDLSEVQVILGNIGARSGEDFLRIRANAQNEFDENIPGALLGTLTPPSSFTADALNTFTASPAIILSPDTTYWVTVNEGRSNANMPALRPVPTYVALQGSGHRGEAGWSIGTSSTRTFIGGEWNTFVSPIMIVARGTVRGLTESEEAGEARLGQFGVALPASLGGGGVALSPVFAPDRKQYNAAADADRVELTMIPLNRSAPTVRVFGHNGEVRVRRSGEAGSYRFRATVPLILGAHDGANLNQIRVGVTAVDGTSHEFYRLYVRRRGPAPALLGASATPRGNPAYFDTVALGYDKSLRQGQATPGSAFSVTVDGYPVTVRETDIFSNRVLLRLDQRLTHRTQRVRVSYTPPAANPVQTLEGGLAPAFTDFPVNTNQIPSSIVGRHANGLFDHLMTVGYNTNNNDYGYFPARSVGSLSGTAFRFNGVDYTITRLLLEPNSAGGRLQLWLSGRMTEEDAERLELYVGGHRLRFSRASSFLTPDTPLITWQNTGLTWLEGATIPVAILEANDAPAFRHPTRPGIVFLEENPRNFGSYVPPRSVRLIQVQATDGDGDAVRHTLEGRDADLFTIDAESGWVSTKKDAIYDYETEERACGDSAPCYDLTVRATDSRGASATKRLNILLRDRPDRVVQNLRAEAQAGRNDALRVSWNAPGGDDRPTAVLVSYDIDGDGLWHWHMTTFEGDLSTALLTSLEPNTRYRVRVALQFDSDGDVAFGPWSPTIVKSTGSAGGPELRVAEVLPDGETVELHFDEAIRRTRLPDADDVFTVIADGREIGVESAIGAGGDDTRIRIALNVEQPLRSERTVTVAYTAPTGGSTVPALRNAQGVAARSFTREAVNHASLSAAHTGVGPAPVSAEVATTGVAASLVFDEILEFVNVSNPGFLQVTVDGNPVTVTNATSRPGTRILAMIIATSDRIGAGQTVTISYTDPNPGVDDTANVIQDTDGNDAASVTAFPATNNSTQAGAGAPPEPLTAAFEDLPRSHGGAAFTVGLAFSEAFLVTEAAIRAGLAVTGGTLGTVAPAEEGNTRNWRVGVTPADAATRVTLTLSPQESCEAENAICTADGRNLSEAVKAGIEGRPPTVVTGVAVTSTPGDNGTWDTGETVEAEVRFSQQVSVYGRPGTGPLLTILLDGVARQAAYTGGRGTDTLSFAWTVTAADDGARRAWVAADGLDLNGTVIGDTLGRHAELGFSVAPYVTAVALAADASGDGEWTAGESIEARLTFSEPVTVADGTPTLGVSVGGEAATLDYASGSGSAVLVFSRAVTEADGSLAEIAVTADSLALGGATVVSQASSIAAELGHDGTEPTAAPEESVPPVPLTAAFLDAPEAGHNGSAFTVKLRFSEELSANFSYKTLRDRALSVSGGTLTRVARTPRGQNRAWAVTVAPSSGAGDVTVTLASSAGCSAAGAICTEDDRRLAAPVSTTVARSVQAVTSFTVRLVDAPDEHDGTSGIVFEVQFNKEPAEGYSSRTMRYATLKIRRGASAIIPQVRRIDGASNKRWVVTVEPDGKKDVTVSIGPFFTCSDTGAVCAADDEVLSNAVSATILGPPGLSVADARVEEGPGATVDFAVTLGRESSSTVTVDYATSDGTGENAAVAGSDYTATSGTLTFAPGETAKTVSVPVLDDAHDEGEETFTLTLSNPQGGNAWLKDATATGTIENTDAMPQAWLARFGRTVAEQAIEAVEGRFAASRAAGVEMTLAGQRIGAAGAAPEDAAARKTLAGEQESRSRLEAMTTWLRGTEAAEGDAGNRRAGYRSRTVTPRDLVLGSSFSLTGEAKAGGLVSLWGRAAVSRFDGREGDLSLDGEVTSALLGADWARERWTAGLLVSRSVGEGGYRGEGEGAVSSTLTGLFPYGRYELNPRLTVWGIAGYGAGELVLTPEGQSAMRADMDLAMGAAGLRGVAVEAPAEGGVELAVKTDAMAVRTTSEKTRGMAAAEADVTRLRLALEGTYRGLALGTGTLVPTAEIGVRHDGGDAETGFGLDLGGGLAWSDPESGLTAEFRGRGLLTHESEGFRDRGLSGSFAWAPGQGSGRGPSLTLTQTMGASAAGGADALLGQRHLGGLAANDDGGDGNDLANRRLELRMGYGFSAFGDRFTSTPELGLGLSNGHREYTLGWRLGLVGGGTNALELRIEGTRREAAGANDNAPPEHGAGFRVTARW